MKTLLSYLNNEAIKTRAVERIRGHAEYKTLKQGFYYNPENDCGCAVGVQVQTGGRCHELFEDELGIPEELAYLLDVLFEGLPLIQARQFACDFFEVIPVGVNLQPIVHHYAIFLLDVNEAGIRTLELPCDNEKLGDEGALARSKTNILAIIDRIRNQHQQAIHGVSFHNTSNFDEMEREIRVLTKLPIALMRGEDPVWNVQQLAAFAYAAKYLGFAFLGYLPLQNAVSNTVSVILTSTKAPKPDHAPFAHELITMLRNAR